MSVGVRFKYARTLEVLSTLEAEHEDMKKSTTKALAEKDAKVKQLEEEVRKLMSEANDLRDSVSELRTQAGAGAQEKQQELDALRQKMEEERSRASLREQELSQSLSASQQQVSDLQNALEKLSSSFENERKEAALDSQSKALLEQELADCNRQLSHSQERGALLDKEVEALQAKLKSLKGDSAATASEESKKREAAERAKQEMQELLELAQRKLSDAQRTNKVLKASQEELRATATSLQSELTERTAAHEESESHRRSLEEELSGANREFEEERKRLMQRIQELEREIQASGGSKFRKFVELKAHTKKVEQELSNLRDINATPPGVPPSGKTGGRRLKAASQRRRPEDHIRRHSSSNASDDVRRLSSSTASDAVIPLCPSENL